MEKQDPTLVSDSLNLVTVKFNDWPLFIFICEKTEALYPSGENDKEGAYTGFENYIELTCAPTSNQLKFIKQNWGIFKKRGSTFYKNDKIKSTTQF